MTNKKAEQAYNIFKVNPFVWGQYYFPHHFRMESPIFHIKLISECIKNRFFAVAAPRGHAKSTIISFLNPIHSITFQKVRHIVIVQNTFSKAAGSLETIASEFKENKDIINDYGVKITRDREGDKIFTHPSGFKTRVICKGCDQIGSIRGEKFGAYRPDLIIVDDLEADEQCKNPEVRDDLLEKYKDALEPAIDPETGRIHVVGTILHEDSIMNKLVSHDHFTQYRKLKYKARYMNKVTGELSSLWKDLWSVEALNELEKNEPSKFAKEYQNDPVSGLLSNFDKEDFRYWYIEEGDYVLLDKDEKILARGSLKNCKGAISTDLAWGEKKVDDFSVLMPGYITPDSEILIDEYICERGMKPDDFINYIFPMVKKVERNTGGSCPIGFEKGKIEKVMKWFLRKAERENNKFLIKRDILWDNDKISRIVTRLQSRYKNHVIFHRRGMGDLEHQLLTVPSGKHDDLPDAAQGLVQMFQFAPGKKTKAVIDDEKDDGFEWLKKNTLNKKNKPDKKFVFGKKSKKWELPAKKSFR